MNQNFFRLVYAAASDDQKFFLDERASIFEYEANCSAEIAEVRALADFFNYLANEHAHFTDIEQ